MLRRKNVKNYIMSVWQLETSIDRLKSTRASFPCKVAIYEKGLYVGCSGHGQNLRAIWALIFVAHKGDANIFHLFKATIRQRA